MVWGFVEEVVVLCRGEGIARHPRSYGTGVFVADPLHYLALIEVKANALNQAAALQGWNLPETFQHMRHLLEARMGNRGKREFIQVLRLMEALPREVVSLAVGEAIRLSAIGFDAVKLIALARMEGRPARLDLAALLSGDNQQVWLLGDRELVLREVSYGHRHPIVVSTRLNDVLGRPVACRVQAAGCFKRA